MKVNPSRRHAQAVAQLRACHTVQKNRRRRPLIIHSDPDQSSFLLRLMVLHGRLRWKAQIESVNLRHYAERPQFVNSVIHINAVNRTRSTQLYPWMGWLDTAFCSGICFLCANEQYQARPTSRNSAVIDNMVSLTRRRATASSILFRLHAKLFRPSPTKEWFAMVDPIGFQNYEV
jgi:hypothetical protein